MATFSPVTVSKEELRKSEKMRDFHLVEGQVGESISDTNN